jgi:hypothetical protein
MPEAELDLHQVRELFDVPSPPSAEVTAAARARLPLGPAPRGRRPWLRVALPAAAVATGAAVAAALLPAAPPASPRPAGGGRGVLLAAALAVSRQPPAPALAGRFYVVRSEVGNFQQVGPATAPYVIMQSGVSQFWRPRAPMVLGPVSWQELGVTFASAADRAAWRRDGSPTRWSVGADTSLAAPDGAADTSGQLTAGPRPPRVTSGITSSEPFWFGQGMSAAQLRQLPADPARLQSLILRGYQGPAEDGMSRTEYLFQLTPQLLTLPLTRPVEAALYRMLAVLPAVRSLGTVRDVAGQAGVAVARTARYADCGQETVYYPDGSIGAGPATFPSCVVQQRLVIDPATGRPLAVELRYVSLPAGRTWPAPGGLFSFQVFQAAGWTSATPPPEP